MVRLAVEGAIELYSTNKGEKVFCAATFSNSFCRLAGARGPIDGKVVRAGRADVEILPGGGHFRLRERA